MLPSLWTPQLLCHSDTGHPVSLHHDYPVSRPASEPNTCTIMSESRTGTHYDIA